MNDRRLRLVGLALAAIWGILVLRAGQVQLLQHSRWLAEGRSAQELVEPVPARRGDIRTVDGEILARTVLNRSLAVDPSRVEDPKALAAALDSLGLVERAAFLEKLERRREQKFLWVSREILPETDLSRLIRRFDALIDRTEEKRLYPLSSAGGPVIGLVGTDEKPLGGLEYAYDSVLVGSDGQLMRIVDATGTKFRGIHVQTLKDPVPGSDLEVTLNARIQEIAAAHLAEGVAREGATSGYCVVTRPATGEILAMVSAPAADPANSATWEVQRLRVPAVTDNLEPGSSYKLVTFAAALEAGLLHTYEIIDCMNGVRPAPGGRPITDHHPLGKVPAWLVLAQSSNIGSGILAERVGAERFYRTEKALGFGLPPGLGLPGEERGRIPEPWSPAWSARSLITMAFGQELSCTGLQLAMAYGAVANGGSLMRPILVRSIRASDGRILETNDSEVIRAALRPSVALELRELMRRVVTDGTGQKAEIPGLEPAGKTSTAQKYIAAERRYSTRRYVASFVGFAPYKDPRILCLVVLDEPTSSIYGGNVAAPIFARIVADAYPFLEGESTTPSRPPVRWRPQERDPRREIPAVEGLAPVLARRIVEENGFLVRLTGRGGRVLSVDPPAGEWALPGTVVSLELEEDAESEAGSVPMPDLLGLSLRDAWLRARSAGAVPRVQGTGWVVSQYPRPGESISPGGVCRLTLGPDSCRAWKEFLESERAAWAATGGDLLVGSAD